MNRLERLSAGIVLFYPVFCFGALWLDKRSWVVTYLAGACILQIWQSWTSRSWRALAGWLGLGCVISAGIGLDLSDSLLWMPPLLITLGLFLLFSLSLRNGITPLITRIAAILDGDLSEEQRAYTRRVTQLWSGFMLLMLVEIIVLSLWASPVLWSMMTNVVNYLLILLLLLVEFVYRRRRFQDHTNRQTFVEFLRRLSKIQPSTQRL